jgi:DNA-directed RNA polymerase
MLFICLFLVNSQKQATAFPPNFIHSLDATHMLLTALECRVCFPSFCTAAGWVSCSPSSLQTQDLTFASVHDSYWTHPSTIDQMSTIIRETFIALHSSDVLGRLLNEVTCSHPASILPSPLTRCVVCIY